MPFVIFAGAVWLLVFILGGLGLISASPFILATGGRALFITLAARWLASTEQREQKEAAVMSALGLHGGSIRRLHNQAARVMDADEFAEVMAKPQKGAEIRLGKVSGAWFDYATEKHVLVCASTRGGKGVSLIIPNLLRYRGSVFVLDPKGENAKITHEERREFGTVQVLDPFGVSGLPAARFNPLATLHGDMMVTDAQMMADALVEGKEDHWNSSARGLITGLLLHVATAPDIKTRDLPTLRTLLMGNLNATLEAMTKNSHAPQEVRDVGAWGMGAAEDEWSSIVSNAIEQTKWLASPQIADCLRSGGEQVDFSRYRDSVQSVFVCLPAPYFRTFAKWLRLVVAASIDTLTKQLNHDMPLPTRFVLDELAQLGTLEKVESALTLSAGYGVQLWGIWQHLKDIERCYPRSGVAGWVSSSGVRLVFATQDNDSVRYFAGMCGGALSETDIRHMRPDQMLCLLDGQNPLIVERVPFYEWHTAKPAQPKPKPKAAASAPAPAPAPNPATAFGMPSFNPHHFTFKK
jgi:type IV secretory pathway TraG/TraD family ATPase VirD4